MNARRDGNRSDTNNTPLKGQSNWLVQIFTQRHFGDSVDNSFSDLVCVGPGVVQKSIWECSSSCTDEGCDSVCADCLPLCVVAGSKTRLH